jgi:DNA-binding LacI/PurR family transcriptional regulator
VPERSDSVKPERSDNFASDRFGALCTVRLMPPRSHRPTIVDVAAAAGVSRTTASDALNGRSRVSAETRTRVIAAAVELGYRANVNARGLRSGRTSTLALMVPTIEAAGESSEALGLYYYARLTGSVAAAAFGRGYAVVLIPPLDDPARLSEFAFDGAIVADPDTGDKRLALLDRMGVPVVTIERDLARLDDRWYVTSDTDRNTRVALEHLAEHGAQRIALLTPDAPWAWVAETIETYGAWCRDHEFERIVRPVRLQRFEDSATATSRRLLSGPDRPDAIVALGERYAVGALRAAVQLGLRVPEDLLIVAGVDSHATGELTPGITALDLHPEHQAVLAVAMLANRLAGHPVDAPQIVRGSLIVRGSTQRQ